MILPDTSYENMYEVLSDEFEKVRYQRTKNLRKKLKEHLKKPASLYQINNKRICYYDYYTVPDSQNKYIYWVYADSLAELVENKYNTDAALIVTNDKGQKNLIVLNKIIDTDGNIRQRLAIYTGHFFSRYRERMKINPDISSEELMLRYFHKNNVLHIRLNLDKMNPNAGKYKNGYAFRLSEGVAFASEIEFESKYKSKVLVQNYKTFISESQMTEMQKKNEWPEELADVMKNTSFAKFAQLLKQSKGISN